MNQIEKLEILMHIFASLREGNILEEEIIQLCDYLELADVKWMMTYVESIREPEEYLIEIDEYDREDNAKSKVIVHGFFKFIDLVSGLIIKLGDEAIEEAKEFENSPSQYVPWVLKYCTDEGFVKAVSENFPFLKI